MSHIEINTVQSSKKTKIALALTAASAIALAPILLQGSLAHAATVDVGADDVQPIEIGGMDPSSLPADYNYDEWHIGTTGITAEQGATLFNFDNPAGITLLPNTHSGSSTQLLKGNHISNIDAGTYDMTHTEFEAFVTGLSTVVASGSVHFQIAGEIEGDWTTLRPVIAHSTATGTDLLDVEWIGTSPGGPSAPMTMREMLEEMASENVTFNLYGVGVVITSEATVASIAFGGTTYNFAAPSTPAPTPGGVETATGANNTAAISITLMAGLALAIGAVAVRRKVQA